MGGNKGHGRRGEDPGGAYSNRRNGEREVVRWHSVTRLEGLILRWRHSNIYLAGCCKCLNGKERNLLRTVDVKEEGN